MRLRQPALWLMIAGAPALLASACSQDTSSLGKPGSPADTGPSASRPDAGAAAPDAAPLPDASAPDAESPPDAGMIAAPDAGPVRQLVSRHLFGQMPVDNYVMDPEFDLTTFNWVAFTAQGMPAFMRKRYEAATPTDQPMVMVPKAPDNVGQIFVTGTAETSGGPMTASIWIGRPGTVADSSVSVSLMSVTASAAPASLDLAVDSQTPPTTMSGIRWKRYQAAITSPPVGWLHFFVTDTASDPYAITSPEVLRAASHFAPGSEQRDAWRPLRPLERVALDALRKEMNRRFVPAELRRRRTDPPSIHRPGR